MKTRGKRKNYLQLLEDKQSETEKILRVITKKRKLYLVQFRDGRVAWEELSYTIDRLYNVRRIHPLRLFTAANDLQLAFYHQLKNSTGVKNEIRISFPADVFRYVFGEENEMWVYMSDFKKLRMAENWYFILDERIDCGKCVLFPIRVKFSVRKTARFYSEKLTVILSLEACDESTTLQERDLEDVLREQEVLREQDVGDME